MFSTWKATRNATILIYRKEIDIGPADIKESA